MHLYLPIAGNAVNVWAMVGLGGVVGFLSGLFGVGGGFLMTPLLMMLGIPPTVAAASDSNQIVAASASGCYAHFRARTVDIRMGLLMLVGGVVGGTLGVQLIKVLRHLGEADFVISAVYVLMLGGIGSARSAGADRRLRMPGRQSTGGSLRPCPASCSSPGQR